MVKVKSFTFCPYLGASRTETAVFSTFANAKDALERAGYRQVPNTGGKHGRARFKWSTHLEHGMAIIYHYSEGSAIKA